MALDEADPIAWEESTLASQACMEVMWASLDNCDRESWRY